MKWVYLLICIFLFTCVLAKRKYRNQYLVNIKKSIGAYLYPAIAYALDKIKYFEKDKIKKKKKRYMVFYPGEDVCRYNQSIYEKFARIVLIIWFSSFFSFCILITENYGASFISDLRISRPEYGADSKYLNLIAILKTDGGDVKKELILEVKPRNYTEKEIKEQMAQAKENLKTILLGNNSDFNEVNLPLNLISQIPNTPIKVSWRMLPDKIVNSDGSLNNQTIQKPVIIQMFAELSYEEIQEECSFEICVLPYIWSWQEKVKQEFKDAIVEEDELSSCDGYYILPQKTGQATVTYQLNKQNKTKEIIVLGIVLVIAVFVFYEEKIKNTEKKRLQQIMLDYPELVNKLTLLIGAGMTVKRAWNKIIEEYNKSVKGKKRKYIYEEMIVTWNEIENGVSDITAFEHFGQRIKLKSYLRLVSLLSQNMKKGSKGLLELLDHEVRNAMEERKQTAKKSGEEAGTKLLVPMMILLGVVLVIVMVPAFLSMS